MAKLNGVKTLDMVNGEITKVEYGGELYKKVAGQAQVGDLALRVKGNQFEISVGSFYLVERIRGIDEVMVNDDADDLSYRYTSKFDIFRKITADRPPTSEYVLVTDREPKAGDFVKFSEEYADDDTDLTAGKYYKITKVEDGTCVVFFDDDCDMRFKRSDVSGVEVYELVAEQAPAAEPSQYREVKREAKVGELIKIVDAYDELDYKNGDIRKVTGAYPETSDEYAHVEIEPNSAAVLTKEYVVLEPVATTTTLTHKGAEYTLVDRKAHPGDVVVFTETTSRYFTNGKVYGPVDDDICVIDNEGDELPVYSNIDKRTPANVKVYQPKVAPVAPKLQVGDFVKVVSAGQFGGVDVGEYGKVVNGKGGPDEYRVDKLDRSDHDYFYAENLVKVTEEEATKQLLKVGDYAKVVNATTYHRLSDGNIVEVIGNSGYHGNLRVKRLIDGMRQNVPKEQLVKATDEEVAAAKAELTQQFEVGDYVVALASADDVFGVTNTAVKLAKVTEIITDDFIEIEIISHQNGIFIGDTFSVVTKYFRKATDEEVAEAKRQAEEKAAAARWAAIGRKPNEFKQGDIVCILEDNAHGSNHKSGDIGVVDSEPNKEFRVRTPRINSVNFVRPQDVELITPVEHRFDLQSTGDIADGADA